MKRKNFKFGFFYDFQLDFLNIVQTVYTIIVLTVLTIIVPIVFAILVRTVFIFITQITRNKKSFTRKQDHFPFHFISCIITIILHLILSLCGSRPIFHPFSMFNDLFSHNDSSLLKHLQSCLTKHRIS